MNRRARIDVWLGEVPLFQGLSKKQLRLVASLATRLDAPAGAVVVREGGHGSEFIIMVEGHVEVRRGGRLIATRGPGEYVGEMALVDHHPRTATVRTITPARVEVIARREFDALLADVPDVADRIHARIAERRQTTSSPIEHDRQPADIWVMRTPSTT
jgi:CRP/FNR family transcriptional regulator, cyclic AMP receptor protein